jgi:hypothetical protein
MYLPGSLTRPTCAQVILFMGKSLSLRPQPDLDQAGGWLPGVWGASSCLATTLSPEERGADFTKARAARQYGRPTGKIQMPEKDYQGVVTSVSVPFPDDNGEPSFVFGMIKPSYQPPNTKPGNVPVFYVALSGPFVELIADLVLTSYRLGVEIQVGLVSSPAMHVAWVQLPDAPNVPGDGPS